MATRSPLYDVNTLDRLLAVIPSLPRPLLARLTTRMIEKLDDMDGDPDIEPNGDELDGTLAEDDHGVVVIGYGPGCRIADDDHDPHN